MFQSRQSDKARINKQGAHTFPPRSVVNSSTEAMEAHEALHVHNGLIRCSNGDLRPRFGAPPDVTSGGPAGVWRTSPKSAEVRRTFAFSEADISRCPFASGSISGGLEKTFLFVFFLATTFRTYTYLNGTTRMSLGKNLANRIVELR